MANIRMTRWKRIFQSKNLSYVYSDGKSFKIEVPVFGGHSMLKNPSKKEHQEILEFLEKIEGVVEKLIEIEKIINKKIEENN